jgi:hypothetical protein
MQGISSKKTSQDDLTGIDVGQDGSDLLDLDLTVTNTCKHRRR